MTVCQQLTLFAETSMPLPGAVAEPDQFERWVCSDYRECRHGERCRLQPVGPDARCYRRIELDEIIS